MFIYAPNAILIGITFNPIGLDLDFFVRYFYWVFTIVQVAVPTIFDMAKAVDKGMVMGDFHFLEKCGGKS
jgi:hypothetical protein